MPPNKKSCINSCLKTTKIINFFIADKKRLVQSMPNATLTSNYDEHFCKHINFWVKHIPF